MTAPGLRGVQGDDGHEGNRSLLERAPEKCILCGSRGRELLIEKDSMKVHRCSNCGLGFLDPRPSQEELEDLYREAYFSERYDEGVPPGSPEYKRRLGGEEHRIKFIRKERPSGRLLDIGCGYGYFLAASRNHGYEVEGVDVSRWAARYAIEELGLPVTLGQIKDIVFPGGGFDVITMWHFLEHAQDPHLVLRQARSWLKQDGILVIDVPNYEGTDARKMWNRWDGWSLPYHLWHFTDHALRELLAQHGLAVVRRKDYHSDFIKARLRRILLLRPFARLIAKMYSGTSIAVISRIADTRRGRGFC